MLLDPEPGVATPASASTALPEADSALATVDGMLQWRERGFSLATLVAQLGRLRGEVDAAREAQARVERARGRLQRQLEGLHSSAVELGDAVTFVCSSAESCSEVRIMQSRSLVRRWSPVFELLVRHGNGMCGDSPEEVRVSDADPAHFQAVVRYMVSGRLEEGCVASPDSCSHPVLELADRFDLPELVDDYFELLLQANPLCAANVGRVLELALCHGARAATSAAASFLACRVHGEHAAFLSLGAAAAATVLERDDLHVGQRGAENDVLQLALRWAKHEHARAEQVHLLLRNVRLELLSLRELTDLQSKSSSRTFFGRAARQHLRSTIRATLRQKLATPEEGGATQPVRKRDRTVLANDASEESARKMLRATLGAFGAGFLRPRKGETQDAACDKENSPPTRQQATLGKERAPATPRLGGA